MKKYTTKLQKPATWLCVIISAATWCSAYSKNPAEHVNKLCEQNTEFNDVKYGSNYHYGWDFGLQI